MKKLSIALLLIFFSTMSFGQYYQGEEEKSKEARLSDKTFWERVNFGGTFSLAFGGGSDLVLVSPVGIYQASENLLLGLGANYVYSSYKVNYINGVTETYTASVYGPKAIVMFFPFESILLSGEFEHNYVDRNYSYVGDKIEPYWQSSAFVGIGYAMPIGERGRFVVSISYDLLYDQNKSYFSTPYRPGVGIYF
jgi:hypothetical protein